MIKNHNLIILHLIPGFRFSNYQTLKAHNIDLEDFINTPATYKDLISLKPATLDFLNNKHYLPLIASIANWCQKSDQYHIIAVSDTNYPHQLKQIPDPPLILYAIGNIKLLCSAQLAIVGTRNATPYAKETLAALIPDLLEAQLTITSGLALGVDTLAHQITLDNYGKTIAVLGTGVNRCYPYQNRKLFENIQQQGLVISELPLSSEPKRFHFPRRNRIISGLSSGVLVVEAAKKSGALITAFHALEQNRDIFAIPGNIFHITSEGPHKLIKMGAKVVSQSTDILEELNLSTPPKQKITKQPSVLTEQQRNIYHAIDSSQTSIDQIIIKTNLTYAQITAILFELEMEKLIRPVPGGYQRT